MPGEPDAVQLWDAATGQDVRRWSGPSGQVLALAVASDRAHVAGATSDRGVVIWNAATGEERAVLKSTPKRERAEIVAYAPNGRWLAAGYSGKSEIRLWDAGTLVSKAGFAGLGRQFRSVVFSPDGRWLAAGTQDGTLFLWRLDDGVELLSRRVDIRSVRLLAFTADSRTLTVVGESGVFQQWATAPE